jgi:hypothetical protein
LINFFFFAVPKKKKTIKKKEKNPQSLIDFCKDTVFKLNQKKLLQKEEVEKTNPNNSESELEKGLKSKPSKGSWWPDF